MWHVAFTVTRTEFTWAVLCVGSGIGAFVATAICRLDRRR